MYPVSLDKLLQEGLRQEIKVGTRIPCFTVECRCLNFKALFVLLAVPCVQDHVLYGMMQSVCVLALPVCQLGSSPVWTHCFAHLDFTYMD